MGESCADESCMGEPFGGHEPPMIVAPGRPRNEGWRTKKMGRRRRTRGGWDHRAAQSASVHACVCVCGGIALRLIAIGRTVSKAVAEKRGPCITGKRARGRPGGGHGKRHLTLPPPPPPAQPKPPTNATTTTTAAVAGTTTTLDGAHSEAVVVSHRFRPCRFALTAWLCMWNGAPLPGEPMAI